MGDLLKNPAVVVGLVRAVLIVLVSFGVQITQDQQDSVILLTGAILAVLSLILTGITVTKTTSVADPVIPEGTTVTVQTPEGQSNYRKVV